jgi:hypothetical protein
VMTRVSGAACDGQRRAGRCTTTCGLVVRDCRMAEGGCGLWRMALAWQQFWAHDVIMSTDGSCNIYYRDIFGIWVGATNSQGDREHSKVLVWGVRSHSGAPWATTVSDRFNILSV